MSSDNINPYSLYEVIVSKTNSDASSYEDPIALYKDQLMTVTPIHDTDQQRDSGAITSTLSVQTHGELTLQAGGVPFDAAIMMMGANSSTSGAVVTIDPETGITRPYWGAIGVAPTEDDRYLAVGLYKCQLQADPVINFDGTTNAWITNEMSALALAKASVRRFQRFKIYDTLSDWIEDKPADGTEVLAWFS